MTRNNNIGFIKLKCLVAMTVIFSTLGLQAENNFGAGVVLGDPTGLSFKYNLSKSNSVDAALSWSDSINIHMHADYLWNKPKLFYLDHYPMDLFYGVGARIKDPDDKKYRTDDDADMRIGLRAPVGLRFMFNDPRIEIFSELALLFNLTPSTSADIDFGIGARYFF